MRLKCLDTGEEMPLSEAERLLPPGLSPLALQVMRRTNEFSLGSGEGAALLAGAKTAAEAAAVAAAVQQQARAGGGSGGSGGSHDDGGADSSSSDASGSALALHTPMVATDTGTTPASVRTASASASASGSGSAAASGSDNTRGQRMRRLLTRAKEKAREAKDKAVEKAKSTMQRLAEGREDDEDGAPLEENTFRVASHVRDRPRVFHRMQLSQKLGSGHQGAVWAMRFSPCGRLLATAGQDRTVRVWVLLEHFAYFHDYLLRNSHDSTFATREFATPAAGDVFHPTPLLEYRGHTSDVLDICWSPSRSTFVLLSSSMDMTVRLWHLVRREALASFPHEDFVTALAFHPRVRRGWRPEGRGKERGKIVSVVGGGRSGVCGFNVWLSVISVMFVVLV